MYDTNFFLNFICNLKFRVCKENRIFAGLWHGLKPNMSLFLKPLAKFLQAAFEDG